MEYALIALHILACLFLILVVLLQSGQAADLAGAFGGGGSQTALGMRGATTLLHKLTTGAAVVFMLTSLSLGLVGRYEPSVLEGLEAQPAEQPATPGEAASPDGAAGGEQPGGAQSQESEGGTGGDSAAEGSERGEDG